MSDVLCAKCYYGDVCSLNARCEYYTPVDEQAIDDAINTMTENQRIAFRREWFEYIECYDN